MQADRKAVQRVLREASDHENFTGWTFAQRLIWMIGRGYALGRREAERPATAKNVGSGKHK